MKNVLLASVCGVALLSASGSASAEGMYIGGLVGGNWLSGPTFDQPTNPGPRFNLDYSGGFAGSAVLGFMMAPGFRFEGELSLRTNNVVPTTEFEGTVSGSTKTFSLMANGWYDFHPMGQFRPYVGGGVGVANAHFDIIDGDDPTGGNVNASQTVFAYQLGAGVGYALTNGIVLSVDYRFFGTGPVALRPLDGPPFGVEGQLHNHSVMIGARFDLGSLIAPPPDP